MRPVIYIEKLGLRFTDPVFPEEVRGPLSAKAAEKAAKIIRHYGYEAVVVDHIVDWLQVFAKRNPALSRCPIATVADKCNRRLLNAVNKALEAVEAIDRPQRWWYTMMWLLQGRDPYAEAEASLET